MNPRALLPPGARNLGLSMAAAAATIKRGEKDELVRGGRAMDLELESGRVIHEATEEEVRAFVEHEDFAVLTAEPNWYIQCAQGGEPPYEYLLEYQDGSLAEHYRAVDGPITAARVVAAFVKYLRGDASWKNDFRWEKLDL